MEIQRGKLRDRSGPARIEIPYGQVHFILRGRLPVLDDRQAAVVGTPGQKAVSRSAYPGGIAEPPEGPTWRGRLEVQDLNGFPRPGQAMTVRAPGDRGFASLHPSLVDRPLRVNANRPRLLAGRSVPDLNETLV